MSYTPFEEPGPGQPPSNPSPGPPPAPTPTPPKGFPPPGPGDISLDSLSLGPDGHLYGERRIISGDPSTPGMSKYDFESADLGDAGNLAQISQTYGISVGALQE